MQLRKAILVTYVTALALIPVVLLILPAGFFDHGQSLCLSVLLFHQKCYGCGMTRAVQHLVHLDFAGAAGFNKLSFAVVPLLGYVWGQELFRLRKKLKRMNASIASSPKE